MNAVAPVNGTVHSAWRLYRPIALALTVAAVIALHGPTAMLFHALWLDTDATTYTHGYLIGAVSLWLLWQRRAAASMAEVDPTPAALFWLAVAQAAWLVANQAGIQLGAMVLLPAILWLVVWCVFGYGMARHCLFPFGYLYFAIPLWGLLNPLAQWSTVYATRLMLSAVGVTAYFEDNLVHLRSGTFEIAGGCSGLHFIMVALSLAALVGELRQDRLRMRFKLAGLALLLAVLTNWVRVFVIIVAGDMTDMQHYLVRVSHYGFGWAVFAAAMTGFFLIEGRLKPDPQRTVSHGMRVRAGLELRTWIWPVTALVLVLPAAINALISSRQQPVEVVLANRVGDWSGAGSVPDTAWSPVFAAADAEARGSYQLNGNLLEVYSAGYAVQEHGKKLGGYNNSVLGSMTLDKPQVIALAGQRPFNVAQVSEPGGQESTVWYSYAVGEHWFTNPVVAQLWYAAQSISKLRPQGSRVLAIRAKCALDCVTANQAIAAFLVHWK